MSEAQQILPNDFIHIKDCSETHYEDLIKEYVSVCDRVPYSDSVCKSCDRHCAIKGLKSGWVSCLYIQGVYDAILHSELQTKAMCPGMKGKEIEWVLYFLHHRESVYELLPACTRQKEHID